MNTLSRAGLSLDNPKIIGKIEHSSVSNSMITGVLGCTARYIAEKYVIKDVMPPEDPLSANVLGSAFHKTMEYYFTFDKNKRSTHYLQLALSKALNDEDFLVIKNNKEAMNKVMDMVRGFYRLDTHPETVDIANIKIDNKTRKGIELFVKGVLGDASRPVLGFIDRLSVDKDGLLVIDDWKTSKRAKHYDPNAPYPDFGFVRQQTIYTMLLEQLGFKVKEARLIYPVGTWEDEHHQEHSGKIEVLPVHDKAVRVKTLDEVKKASNILDSCVSRNMYDLDPSPLCSWCPLVNICPKAMKIKKQNAVDSRSKQPDASVFRPVLAVDDN